MDSAGELTAVQASLKETAAKISGIEEAIENLQKEQPEYWREDAARLWDDKKQLQEKENKLQEEKNILIRAQLAGGGAGSLGGAGMGVFGDVSAQYIGHLFPPPPRELPASTEAMAEYFSQVENIRLPVDAATRDQLVVGDARLAAKLVVTPPCQLASHLAPLLYHSPYNFQSELTTTFAITRFLDAVWKMGNMYSSIPLNYQVYLNCSEKGTTSKSIAKGSRPDTIVIANSATLLVGEDKHASLAAAVADLQRKMAGGFSRQHYGPVQLMLAYAAAGLIFQLHCIDLGGQVYELPIQTFDLAFTSGRVGLVIAVAKAYGITATMAAKLPQVPRRMALFKPVKQPYTFTVHGVSMSDDAHIVRKVMRPSSFVKEITHFDTYSKERHTDLSSIEAAYKAATAAAEGNEYPFLVTAPDPPCLKWPKCFKVVTMPVGYDSDITSVQDLRAVAFTLCRAMQCLHNAGVVHRDIRLPNIVRLDHDHWMLVDLEDVASAPSIVPTSYSLSGWDEATCSRGRRSSGTKVYTPASDMQQIGKLLKPFLEQLPGVSAPARDFVGKLLNKQLDTAETALDHVWLAELQ